MPGLLLVAINGRRVGGLPVAEVRAPGLPPAPLATGWRAQSALSPERLTNSSCGQGHALYVQSARPLTLLFRRPGLVLATSPSGLPRSMQTGPASETAQGAARGPFIHHSTPFTHIIGAARLCQPRDVPSPGRGSDPKPAAQTPFAPPGSPASSWRRAASLDCSSAGPRPSQ